MRCLRPCGDSYKKNPEEMIWDAFSNSLAPSFAIVACGRKKQGHAASARELYTGRLFRARRECVESSGLPWFIFSAKYGMLDPDQVIEPYDQTLVGKGHRQIAEAGVAAVGRLISLLEERGMLPGRAGGRRRAQPCCIEVHAGREYVEALVAGSSGRFVFSWPTRGMQVGQQIAYYAALRRGRVG